MVVTIAMVFCMHYLSLVAMSVCGLIELGTRPGTCDSEGHKVLCPSFFCVNGQNEK